MTGRARTSSRVSRNRAGAGAMPPVRRTIPGSCTWTRSTSTTAPSSSPGVTTRDEPRRKRSPRFLRPARNRYRLHRLAKEYPKYTPADYILSDDPEISIIFQINEECAETGILVDYYSQQTTEETVYVDGKAKKQQVPRWTLDQILDPLFNPNEVVSFAKRHRSSPGDDGFGGMADEVDIDGME